jgi:4-hydroxythreonine-4-phosphate dehydrogenase
MKQRPLIAISMGEPAGVGPELCLKALCDPAILDLCVPVVFGDLAVLREVGRRLNQPGTASHVSAADFDPAASAIDTPLVVDLAQLQPGHVHPGMVSAVTGRASYEYIRNAIDAAMSGKVAAVVTAPIHKEAFHAAGVPYPGHTEMLADLTGCNRYCMMLTSDDISCSLVTTHVGLCEVPDLLTRERILDVILLTDQTMRQLHRRPSRLAVCGLNPHAGEHGLFGRHEEERIILPAIEEARRQGLDVAGPLAPDTAFVSHRRQQTDAYVCMYHDQGLIPLKALAFETAINVTLGLPIIRTSVDHGTALDIAWQGKVDATSLFQAVRWAARMASGTDTQCVG